jgi:LPXTG-site transpeptidase (sortase) family protein
VAYDGPIPEVGADSEMDVDVDRESASSDLSRSAAEPKMTDPDGVAEFLRAARTLVHGEEIPAQRSDSDDWSPGTNAPAVEPTEPEDAEEDPSDWLPGVWVAEPASPRRSGRRRRERPESEKSQKSLKSTRKRGRGRTVDAAAQEGAPGAEVLVKGTGHAPELEPVSEPSTSRRTRKRARRGDAAPAPEAADLPVRPEKEPEQAALARDAAKLQATADRVAANEQAEAKRVAKQARAKAEREAAEAAKAQVKVEREAAKAHVTAERQAAKAQVKAERAAVTAQAGAERASASVRAKAERVAVRTQARLEREAAKAQARVERLAAKAAKVESKAERSAMRTQARAERATLKAQARVETFAAEAAKVQSEADRAAKEAAEAAEAAETAKVAKTQVAVERVDGPTVTTGPTLDDAPDGFLARVPAPRLPRPARRVSARLRRTAKVSLVVVLIAACGALPWLIPAVPKMFADTVPAHSSSSPVKDPPVAAAHGFTGPVGVANEGGPFDGIRLRSAGKPLEVSVPRLHVDSPVVPISGQSGSLLPPSDPQQLGWWKEGKAVGSQYGTAVVTGHTVHTGGGALDHLDKLVTGDSVRVRTDAGWIKYVVQRTRIYSTEQLARDADKIFRPDGIGRLVLITCDDWNGSIYLSNAVVIATPVVDSPFAS